eukprot:CAMPEP_0197679306 /NCGR_PEP_ID=MMETSP1338-20131121/91466_1 /TAXON_ID=43686 ORGANISM="Pelagodinium beii, Strain RCC1491" /NCGR_SAMPLE_ID=MMETSP1338 /ASSEMBLY_ACC=CAM_ASM_000754 /LENGTH=374 /DNA_ID=CAMNT_0043260347 /DNA_START=1 /DNA_END=1125 /DNA_ORIENTATION=+
MLQQLRRAVSGSVGMPSSYAEARLSSASSPASALISSVSRGMASTRTSPADDSQTPLARSPDGRLDELVQNGQSRREAVRQVAQENMTEEIREGLAETITSQNVSGPARLCGSCIGLSLVILVLCMLLASVGVCLLSFFLHLVGWFLSWRLLDCDAKHDLKVWLLAYQSLSIIEALLQAVFKGPRGRNVSEALDARVGAGFSKICILFYSLTLLCAKIYWCVHTQTLVAPFLQGHSHEKEECGSTLVSYLNWYSTILLVQMVIVEPFIRIGLGVVVWLANSGLLETARAAKPGTLDAFQVVEFDQELFADAADSLDSRPQKECCICLEEYTSDSRIVRTPCQHFMHRDCIGRWLKSSHFCPICRGDLEEATNPV